MALLTDAYIESMLGGGTRGPAQYAAIASDAGARAAYIASADADGIVMLWTPLRSGDPYFFRGFDSMITRLAWSSDDQRLVVGERDGKVTSIGFQA